MKEKDTLLWNIHLFWGINQTSFIQVNEFGPVVFTIYCKLMFIFRIPFIYIQPSSVIWYIWSQIIIIKVIRYLHRRHHRQTAARIHHSWQYWRSGPCWACSQCGSPQPQGHTFCLDCMHHQTTKWKSIFESDQENESKIYVFFFGWCWGMMKISVWWVQNQDIPIFFLDTTFSNNI